MRLLRFIRPWIQWFFLFVFISLFIATGFQKVAIAPLFFWFDPLVGIVSSIADRTLNRWLLLAFITILLTIFLGRVWCAWICPLGTILDLVGGRKDKTLVQDSIHKLRMVKYLLLVALIIAALLGNLSLIFLDPITLVYRSFSITIWPAFVWLFTELERVMYSFTFLHGFVNWLESSLRGKIIPAEIPVSPYAPIIGIVFLVVIFANLIRRRFWCRYLCPLGALLGFISKWAFIKRNTTLSCKSCHKCASACPMGTIDPKSNQSDPMECTVCLDCIATCMFNGQQFGRSSFKRPHMPYDPQRRYLLATVGISVLGIGGLSIEPVLRAKSNPLRPPGVQDQQAFLSRCIRCGLCMQVCPTHALQPSIYQSGWVGIWSPLFVPRLGYCLYSCNACGQVCPTGAIPNLSLAKKQKAVIGYAYIDRSRCIPWVDFRNCIVCEEMCPVPEKAIKVEEVEVWTPAGHTVKVKRPHVVHEMCIGCGICENHCPLTGEAAIRIRPATDISSLF